MKYLRFGVPITDSRNMGTLSEEVDKNGTLVSKAREYIHISNTLTLVQRKMINVLLKNAQSKLATQDVFEIDIPKLAQALNIKPNNMMFIKKSFLDLFTIVIEVTTLDNSKSKWQGFTALAGATIEEGVCRYSYAPQMREMLALSQKYTVLDLLIQNNFSSAYALALYENCMSFLDDGFTPWMDLVRCRKLLGATASSYDAFKDLNRYVIKPAVTEINTVSDITIHAEFVRKAKMVTGVRFLVSRKDQQVLVLSENVDEDVLAADVVASDLRLTELNTSALKKWGVGDAAIKKLTAEYSPCDIEAGVQYVQHKITAGTLKQNNVAGYVVKAIKEGWGAQPKPASEIPAKRAVTEEKPKVKASPAMLAGLKSKISKT